jgi:hypothetical protein
VRDLVSMSRSTFIGILIALYQAMGDFPELKKYEGCWPVDDLVLLYLKSTAHRVKLKKQKASKEQGTKE